MGSAPSATLAPAGEKNGHTSDRSSAATVLYVPSAHEPAPVDVRLAELGLDVTPAADAADALRQLGRRAFTLAVVHLADERGAVSALRAIRAQAPLLATAGLMDPARPLVAADAIRAGVGDLLTWPLDPHEVAAVVANARDRMSTTPGDGELAATDQAATIFANSPSMRAVLEQVRAISHLQGGVLFIGDRGTGREVVARALHARSARANRPFVVVDCAADTLHHLESELFGLVTDRRPAGPERRTTERIGLGGAVCRANGGVLFLKNVAEAPTRVQIKLAKLVRDREAGVDEERTVVDLDFRLMASADAGPEAGADDRIRRELYERLSQTRIEVPPFRRRREDIPLLAASMLRALSARHGGSPKTCSRAALVMLSALPWPGNGRDLGALLETLVQSLPRPVIQLDDLFDHVRLDGLAARVEAGGTLRDAKERFERDWISAVLMKHHGRVGEAAKALGIQRTNLYRKVRQLKVARNLLGPKKLAR